MKSLKLFIVTCSSSIVFSVSLDTDYSPCVVSHLARLVMSLLLLSSMFYPQACIMGGPFQILSAFYFYEPTSTCLFFWIVKCFFFHDTFDFSSSFRFYLVFMTFLFRYSLKQQHSFIVSQICLMNYCNFLIYIYFVKQSVFPIRGKDWHH